MTRNWVHLCLLIVCIGLIMVIGGCASSTGPALTTSASATAGPAEDLCVGVRDQLNSSLRNCKNLNNNRVCYGNNWLLADPDDERFRLPKDRIPFLASNLTRVVVQEREDIGLPEGIIVLYLSVGEATSVKIVSIGSVELNPTAEIQSFTLRQSQDTGGSICEAAPPGIMVQAPDGQKVALTINGMELKLGSTAYIAMESPDRLHVTNFEGTVVVEGKPVRQAKEVTVDIDGDRVRVSPEQDSLLYDSPLLQFLATDEDGIASITNLNADPQTSCNRPRNQAFATPLPLPFEEQLTTLAAGHACQLQFCLNAADFVTIRVDTLDPRFNPAVDLRDEDGGYVMHNDATSHDNANAVICNQWLEQGCYMAIAHSYRYASWGAFETSIQTGVQDCEPPLPFCTVTAVEGLNFREEASLQAPVLRTLSRGAQVQDLYETSSDELWKKVRVVAPGSETVGWVWANDYSLVCAPVLPTSPTSQPSTPPPPPTSPTDTPAKKPTSTPPPKPVAPTKEPPVNDPFG